MTNPSDEKLIERLEERNEPGYLNIISDDTICELLDLIGQAAERLRTLAAESAERDAAREWATAWRCRTSGAVFASREGKIIAGSCPVHDATCPLEPL